MSTGSASGATVEVHIQGTNLDDDRWDNPAARFNTHRRGVWELLTGSEVLPRYPGVRSTTWEVPGGQGERRAQHQPIQGRTIPMRVKVWPICTDPANEMYQREGRDAQERLGFLAQNLRELKWRTRLGAQLSGGNLKMTRTLTTGEHYLTGDGMTGGTEACSVSVQADWDEEIAEGAKYAIVTALYRNGAGTWYTPWQYVGRTGLVAGRTYQLEVPVGDAPIDDAMVAVRLQPTAYSGNHRFTNEFGVGFSTASLQAARWHIFNCAGSEWARGEHENRVWNVSKPDRGAMRAHGRPMGSALLIQPGIAGDGRRVGKVNVRLTQGGQVFLAVRPKWF